MRIHYSSLQTRAVCFRISTQVRPARKTPATLVLLLGLGRYGSRPGADRWTAGESDEYGLRLKPVPRINGLLDESVLLIEDLDRRTCSRTTRRSRDADTAASTRARRSSTWSGRARRARRRRRSVYAELIPEGQAPGPALAPRRLSEASDLGRADDGKRHAFIRTAERPRAVGVWGSHQNYPVDETACHGNASPHGPFRGSSLHSSLGACQFTCFRGSFGQFAPPLALQVCSCSSSVFASSGTSTARRLHGRICTRKAGASPRNTSPSPMSRRLGAWDLSTC